MYLNHVKNMYDFEEICEVETVKLCNETRISIPNSYDFLKSAFLKINFKAPLSFYNFSLNKDKPELPVKIQAPESIEIPYTRNELKKIWKSQVDEFLFTYDTFWQNQFNRAKTSLDLFDDWIEMINEINTLSTGIIPFDFSNYTIDTFYPAIEPLILLEFQEKFKQLFITSSVPFVVELFKKENNNIYIPENGIISIEHSIKNGVTVFSELSVQVMSISGVFTDFSINTNQNLHEITFHQSVNIQSISIDFHNCVLNTVSSKVQTGDTIEKMLEFDVNVDFSTLYEIGQSYYNNENVVVLLFEYKDLTFITTDDLLYVKELLATYNGFLFTQLKYTYDEIQDLISRYPVLNRLQVSRKNRDLDFSKKKYNFQQMLANLDENFLEEMYIDDYIYTEKKKKDNTHLHFFLQTITFLNDYEKDIVTNGFIGHNLSFFETRINTLLFNILQKEYQDNSLIYYQYLDILDYDDYYQLKIRLNETYTTYIYDKWLLKQENGLRFNVLSSTIFKDLSMSLVEQKNVYPRIQNIISKYSRFKNYSFLLDKLIDFLLDLDLNIPRYDVFFVNGNIYQNGSHILDTPIVPGDICVLKSEYEVRLYETQYYTKLYKTVYNNTSKDLKVTIDTTVLSFIVVKKREHKLKNIYSPFSMELIVSLNIDFINFDTLQRKTRGNLNLVLQQFVDNIINDQAEKKFEVSIGYELDIKYNYLYYFLLYNGIKKYSDIFKNFIKAIKFYHKDEVIDLLDQNVIQLIDVMYSHNVDYPPFEITTNGKTCYLPLDFFFSRTRGHASLKLDKDYQIGFLLQDHYNENYIETDIVYNFIKSKEVQLIEPNLIHCFYYKLGDRYKNDKKHLRFVIEGKVTNLYFFTKKNISSINIYLGNKLIYSEKEYLQNVTNMYYNKSNKNFLKIPFCINPILSHLQPNGYIELNENIKIDCQFEEEVDENDFILYFCYYKYI